MRAWRETETSYDRAGAAPVAKPPPDGSAAVVVVPDVPPAGEPPLRIVPDEETPAAVEAVELVARRSIFPRILGGIGLVFEWLFGAFTLTIGLAVLATIPVVQFLSLGYLLEASGRIARSGRMRDGFPGVRKAARVGGLVLGTWLWLLPLRLVSDLAYSARLINGPESPVARAWRIGLVVLTVVVVAHILWAWFRGGRLRHFLWPAPILFVSTVVRGGMYAQARDAVWEFVVSLRLPYYFWLGLRGFAGAVAWLVVPVTMLMAASQLPEGAAFMLGLLGSLALAAVLLYLPFLQAQFAAENRLEAMFDLGTIRELFRRAPIAFWIALVVTLLFAIPLYLLKIEFIPREVAWLPSLVFVILTFPARLFTGWAVGLARRREAPRFFLFRWMARLAALPVVAFYVLIVYFTQYLSWYGAYSLYEQHAFLLPVPFVGL
jgi:hypothetical protein